MKIILHISLIFVFSILLLFSCKKSSPTESTGPTIVTFSDINFEILIRETLNKPGGVITDVDLLTITELNGEGKGIINIDGIEHCKNLQKLWLYMNQIIDISTLSALTNLYYLYLGANQIIDIYPLIQNSGIDNGDEVFLTDNPLSETSINTYIPQLEARGVDVSY